MKKIYVLLGQIDDVIAQENSSESNEEIEFTPAMLTEMAGELRKALEQVPEPSTKEEKTALKKETQTAEGTGRTQGQAAGIRQPSGHAAGQELLFQNGQGRYFHENEGGCHA